MTKPVPPVMPPSVTAVVPSKEQAITQSIAHVRFVEYAIASGPDQNKQWPVGTDLHSQLAVTWAYIAASL